MKKRNQAKNSVEEKVAESVSKAISKANAENVEEAVENTEEAIEDAVEETVDGASKEVKEELTEELPEDAEDTVEEVSEELSETESSEDSEKKDVSEESETEEPSEEESETEAEDEEVSEEKSDEKSEEDSEEDSDEETDDEDSEAVVAGSKKKRRLSRKKSENEELDEEEQAKEKSSVYMFFDTLRFVAIGLLVGILLVVFVVQRNDVYGSSMEPTLQSGDAVFVQMITVYTGNFKRGDVVTIDAKGMDGYSHEENLIKRIIGLPGETIKIDDGNVYINGVLLDESDYLPEGTKTYVRAEGIAKGYNEITLGPDEYYCMGDNRGASNDSRLIGPFSKDKLESKVIMRIYPFNKMKFL
ncbi:MAG: signal peptidase I [Clostridiales bacterium]|nr:signal peptidase I [Clostridiales bacterium]